MPRKMQTRRLRVPTRVLRSGTRADARDERVAVVSSTERLRTGMRRVRRLRTVAHARLRAVHGEFWLRRSAQLLRTARSVQRSDGVLYSVRLVAGRSAVSLQV